MSASDSGWHAHSSCCGEDVHQVFDGLLEPGMVSDVLRALGPEKAFRFLESQARSLGALGRGEEGQQGQGCCSSSFSSNGARQESESELLDLSASCTPQDGWKGRATVPPWGAARDVPPEPVVADPEPFLLLADSAA
eukprot:RCo009146